MTRDQIPCPSSPEAFHFVVEVFQHLASSGELAVLEELGQRLQEQLEIARNSSEQIALTPEMRTLLKERELAFLSDPTRGEPWDDVCREIFPDKKG